MKIPDNWFVNETGGGCTAFTRPVDNGDAEWLITQIDDPSAPEDSTAPCILSFYDAGSQILEWHCSCLAEAITIADGATYCT